MHDWTLLSVEFEWNEARITLNFRNPYSETVSVVAEGVTSLNMPKKDEWGRSVSVNRINGPTILTGGISQFAVEMQSGDVIEVLARSFCLPKI